MHLYLCTNEDVSSSRLLARRKTFRRGSMRTPAETHGLCPVPRRSGKLPPKIFCGGLRRTSGEHSADSGGVRGQKPPLHHGSPWKNFRCGRPSAAEIIEGSGLGLGYCIVYTCAQVFTVILKGLPGRF